MKVDVSIGNLEFEQELIRARTGEGRERAKAKGVKMGRKPKLTDHQKREAMKRRDHGEETLAEIGRSYNVPRDGKPGGFVVSKRPDGSIFRAWNMPRLAMELASMTG